VGLKPAEFWRMTFPEVFRQIEGFYERQESEWKRVYVLWSIQKTGESISFDEFMGRKPVLAPADRFTDLWEMIERDRENPEPKVTEHGSTSS